jgi:hypothetical protein
MHENRLPPASENSVRLARQLPPMLSEAISKPVHQAADENFRPGVPGPDPSHPFTALFGREGIHDVRQLASTFGFLDRPRFRISQELLDGMPDEPGKAPVLQICEAAQLGGLL